MGKMLIFISLSIGVFVLASLLAVSGCSLNGPDSPPTYAVTYDMNGAAGGTAPTAQTKAKDVNLTLATNSGSKTHPVGTAGTTGHANELGLYDMSGNVFEWNWDWRGAYPSGTITSDSAAGRGAASGTYRMVCGGSWGNNASGCTVANRYSFNPNYQNYYFGFRVVRP